MSESGKQSGEDDESYSGSSEEEDWDPEGYYELLSKVGVWHRAHYPQLNETADLLEAMEIEAVELEEKARQEREKALRTGANEEQGQPTPAPPF